MSYIEYEYEFEVYAIDDGTRDFCLRVKRLVKIYNVIQLKKMTTSINGVKCIPLEPIADTINLPWFMEECEKLKIRVEFDLENNK